MRSILIKICGITSIADALAAVDAGADLLGFIFVDSSPRHVTAQQTADIISTLNKRCRTVGVFRNSPSDVVMKTKEIAKFDIVQLHGNEAPDAVSTTSPCIKEIDYSGPQSLSEADRYSHAQYILFDRSKEQAPANWLHDATKALAASKISLPFLLAGGIDDGNVAAVVRGLAGNPSFAGIDVCSAIESAPGRKDHSRLRQLVKNAREATADAITR